MYQRFGLFVAGEWRQAKNGAKAAVLSPVTETPLGEAPVASAEDTLQQKQSLLEDPAVAVDAARLQSALAEAEEAKAAVDTLYARWAELEAKQS